MVIVAELERSGPQVVTGRSEEAPWEWKVQPVRGRR